jgi:hypothetical protein
MASTLHAPVCLVISVIWFLTLMNVTTLQTEQAGLLPPHRTPTTEKSVHFVRYSVVSLMWCIFAQPYLFTKIKLFIITVPSAPTAA